MKLLIVTQKVDRQDPILGFFVAWLAEFANHCDRVTVLAQSVASHNLPDNVEVISLGKDSGANNVAQVASFWKQALAKRRAYDRVFVHMTPIWIVLGAPLWLTMHKRMFLWYEIKRGSWKLSLALRLVRNVFAATEHGLPTVSSKQVIVGHGIDTTLFTPRPELREPHHLVAVGRLTRVKHYEVIIRALSMLQHCRLTIAGGIITEQDKVTEQSIKELMHDLGVADRVEIGWIGPDQMPQLLQRADCMLHASQGGLDKVVLQAMSCGCPVVTTSEAAQSVLPEQCHASHESMAEKARAILALSSDARQSLCGELRSTVEANHSLSQCIMRIISHMQ